MDEKIERLMSLEQALNDTWQFSTNKLQSYVPSTNLDAANIKLDTNYLICSSKVISNKETMSKGENSSNEWLVREEEKSQYKSVSKGQNDGLRLNKTKLMHQISEENNSDNWISQLQDEDQADYK